MNRLFLVFTFSLICMIISSCTSGESKAKDTVKTFCEAYNAGQTDKVRVLYPDFTYGVAKAGQIDLVNLKATREGDVWKVEDGANHIFYVEESKEGFLIKDTQNVIFWESKLQGDAIAAKMLGMINENSSDVERLNAYTMLQDGSPLIDFLKKKYPQALAYGVTVENVQLKREGDYGIYWLEVKATLKSGPAKPLDTLSVFFIFKDKDGNEITREKSFASMEANNLKVVEGTADLNDYPNIKDVSIELRPFSNKKEVADIDILCAYAPLTKADYQEYLTTRK